LIARGDLPQPHPTTGYPASPALPTSRADEGRRLSDLLSLVDSELLSRITIEAGKCGGRPCIRGKRKRVTDILQLLSSDATHEELLRDYAFLEREDILAALAYAARSTDHLVLRSARGS
jgi:uncharacterized protein (DUF433 family)